MELVSGAAVTTNKFEELTDTPASITALEYVRGNSGGTALEFAPTPGSEVLHVRDEKASTTQGGASVQTTWTKRTLNTSKTNTISGASLATDQITLPAGTYDVQAWAPHHDAGGVKLRLRDTTGAATLVVGASEYNDPGDATAHTNHLVGRFTLSVTSALELQYYQTGVAVASNGLGIATGSGEVEVYAEVLIRKV